MPTLAVVFATHNGSEVIESVLRGYQQVEAADLDWRLYVVDNGSTDATAQILQAYQDVLPMTVIFVPEVGKNHALNVALARIENEPELYIFTDDDAVPHSDFLIQWSRALQITPDPELFGATVIPEFVSRPPRWLFQYASQFRIIFALNENSNGFVTADDVFGPNMAVRHTVFEKGFRFNESIGPNGRDPNYPMGSETEFCRRVVKESGARVYFLSGPTVKHLVREKQMTLAFIRGRAFRAGLGYARIRFEGLKREDLLPPTLKEGLGQAFRLTASRLGWARLEWQYHWKRGYLSGLESARKP